MEEQGEGGARKLVFVDSIFSIGEFHKFLAKKIYYSLYPFVFAPKLQGEKDPYICQNHKLLNLRLFKNVSYIF